MSATNERPENERPERIGIDFGGVISGGGGKDTASFFSSNYLSVEPQPGAFEGVNFCVKAFGKENVFIVSKAGRKISTKTLEWMEHRDFFNATGFDPKNIHFCTERSEKGVISSTLELSYFLDDLLENLEHVSFHPHSCISSTFLFDPSFDPSRRSRHSHRFPTSISDRPSFTVPSWDTFISTLSRVSPLLTSSTSSTSSSTSSSRPSSSKVCRYFASSNGGCHRGNNCKFLHSQQQ